MNSGQSHKDVSDSHYCIGDGIKLFVEEPETSPEFIELMQNLLQIKINLTSKDLWEIDFNE